MSKSMLGVTKRCCSSVRPQVDWVNVTAVLRAQPVECIKLVHAACPTRTSGVPRGTLGGRFLSVDDRFTPAALS
jgi:hypothetical protein